jgi:hypothetical protein
VEHVFTAPGFFFVSGRQRNLLKLLVTAIAPYKLSPVLASQHHHTPPHPVLLTVDHQQAQISNFPQFGFRHRKTHLTVASVIQVSSSPLLSHLSVLMNP